MKYNEKVNLDFRLNSSLTSAINQIMITKDKGHKKLLNHFPRSSVNKTISQSAFTCPKLVIETLEQSVKYVLF